MKNDIYAFIDSQNLNIGIKTLGWKLDFKKFNVYLKDKFKVKKAFLFIGYVNTNQALYNSLRKSGYTLVFKQTIRDFNGKVKGNIDAELVLHAAKQEYKNYKKAVIVSGDGDFACLYEVLVKENKLEKILIPNRKSHSSLLKKFQKYKVFLDREKEKLDTKKGRRRK